MHRPLDILAIGEAMVEFNQVQSGDGRTYLQGYGGDTSNAVIAAARQGARCAYFTRLGDDDFGRLLLDLWRSEGVACAAVVMDSQAPTGIYFVRHDAAGHRFSYRRAGSAASLMRQADLPSALIASARYLHVSGISQAISDSAAQTVAQAIAQARAAGTAVSFDPNLRLALWSLDKARAALLAMLPLCDELLPSIDDLRPLSGLGDGATPEQLIAWCHAHGARRVVLKLGERGALLSEGRGCTPIATYAVNAVDATGAGDCFDGSYLARRADGDAPLTAARWASAAAALATTGYGAVAPLPRFEAIRALVQSQPRT